MFLRLELGLDFLWGENGGILQDPSRFNLLEHEISPHNELHMGFSQKSQEKKLETKILLVNFKIAYLGASLMKSRDLRA